MNPSLQKELEATLQKQKKTLETELSEFAEKDGASKDNWDTRYPKRDFPDKEERGDDAEEYDNRISIEHSLETKLAAVNKALGKMKEGTYGICEKCGEKIEEERLKALPEAATCESCKK